MFDKFPELTDENDELLFTASALPNSLKVDTLYWFSSDCNSTSPKGSLPMRLKLKYIIELIILN